MFFLLGDTGIHLMRRYYPICSLKINPSTVSLSYTGAQFVSAVDYKNYFFKCFNIIFAYI
jgi:hypothetical protein